LRSLPTHIGKVPPILAFAFFRVSQVVSIGHVDTPKALLVRNIYFLHAVRAEDSVDAKRAGCKS
jgi:hypothetical protein